MTNRKKKPFRFSDHVGPLLCLSVVFIIGASFLASCFFGFTVAILVLGFVIGVIGLFIIIEGGFE